MPSKRNCVVAGIGAIALHAVSVLMLPWARYRIKMKVPVYSKPLSVEFQVQFVATCVTVMDAESVCINFQSNELTSQAVPSTNATTTTTRQLESMASPPRRLASATCSLPGGTTYYDGKYKWVTSTNCCQSCIDAPTCLYFYSRGSDCYLLGSYTSIKSRYLSYTKGYLSIATTIAPPKTATLPVPTPAPNSAITPAPPSTPPTAPPTTTTSLSVYVKSLKSSCLTDITDDLIATVVDVLALGSMNENIPADVEKWGRDALVGAVAPILGPVCDLFANLVACAVGSVVCCAAALILVCVSVHFQVYLVAKVAVVLPNLTALVVLVFWLSTMAPMLTRNGFSATGPGMACLCFALVFYATCSSCAFSYVTQLELLEAASMKLQQPGDVPHKITKLEEQLAAK